MLSVATRGAGMRKMSRSHKTPTVTEALIYQITGSLYFAQRLHCQDSQSLRQEQEQSFQVMQGGI